MEWVAHCSDVDGGNEEEGFNGTSLDTEMHKCWISWLSIKELHSILPFLMTFTVALSFSPVGSEGKFYVFSLGIGWVVGSAFFVINFSFYKISKKLIYFNFKKVLKNPWHTHQ